MESVSTVKREVSSIATHVHGNSKLSEKAQHCYDIIDKETGRVVKTGISGGKINSTGKSVRAESQVRKWNKAENTNRYESVITQEIQAGPGARLKALEYEKKRANQLRLNQELDKNKHIRP